MSQGHRQSDLKPLRFAPHPDETHQVIALGTVPYSPYLPPGTASIMVQALTQNIRYTLNGTTPSATVGFQMLTTSAPIVIEITENMVLQFFREASGSILQYCVGQ